MARTDYIETREDIISNIKTLYSYLHGDSGGDYKSWAIEKLRLGRNMVIEIINGHVCFGPSRFVGYLSNTKDKHDVNHGDGKDTDKRIKQFYQKVADDRLDILMQSELSKYEESSASKKYWIPNDMEIEDILNCSNAKHCRYWIARLSNDDYMKVAIKNNLWLMQQRYNHQKNNIVTQLLNLVKEVKVGDVLLLTYGKTIYTYGYVVKCPHQADHTSNLSNIIINNKYDYYDGIVCFNDADAFYEDLRGGEDNWGQRLSVDQWHYYTKYSSVSNQGCKSACLNGQPRQSLFEVKAEFAQNKIKELKKQYNEKNMFISKSAKLLQSKHNIILQGAPGTGKTYNTAAIALKALDITDVDLTNHKAVMERYDELLGKQIFFTTFHQSLDYEDFVEGLKPHVQTDDKGNSIGVTYEPEDGIFKRACNAAQTDQSKDIIKCIDDYIQKIKGYENKREIPTVSGRSALYVWWSEGNNTINTRSVLSQSTKGDQYTPSPLNIEKVKMQALGEGEENNWRQYAQAFIDAVKREYFTTTNKPVVLIIDEINRGNVSKIFGELITLLESDKRSQGNHPIKLILPYTKAEFEVPSNLYIIGTMNTTDRSTGTLDYAIRRRFAFVTLQSDRSIIEKHYDELGDAALKDKAVALFDDIKKFIESPKHLCGDMSIDDLMVGHSYFMAEDEEELKDKVEYEIVPLINEYINDGILNVKNEEKKIAFDSWCLLTPIQGTDEEEQNEDQ